ncbi:hypothetical protein IWQ60_003331 [Tieghemiomyces parasiticus]|uniref:RING-type E3 ubiquitin transferase BRCA1 n=1 Tax=Tieghemiomyces parasiticus TaxID=78921 RepID=A0A9W8AHN7_9FUNG|nr:hypothetical protein IWQ60_003331 [Tieghemiomyces parasiticus]
MPRTKSTGLRRRLRSAEPTSPLPASAASADTFRHQSHLATDSTSPAGTSPTQATPPPSTPTTSTTSSEKLPDTVAGLLLRLRSEVTCAICQLATPYATHCNHIFCKDCIFQSLNQKNTKCPLCNTRITKRALAPQESVAKVSQAVAAVIASYEAETGVPIDRFKNDLSREARDAGDNADTGPALLRLSPPTNLSQQYPHPIKDVVTDATGKPQTGVCPGDLRTKRRRATPARDCTAPPMSAASAGPSKRKQTNPAVPLNVKASMLRFVASNLSPKDTSALAQLATQMRGSITHNVDDSVTHLIVAATNDRLIEKRTKKYLLALLHGCWIVTTDWVSSALASPNTPETDFEVQGDAKSGPIRGPTLAREAATQRITNQATGMDGRLFTGIRFYLDVRPGDNVSPSPDDIRECISAAGGVLLTATELMQLLADTEWVASGPPDDQSSIAEPPAKSLRTVSRVTTSAVRPDIIFLTNPGGRSALSAQRRRWEKHLRSQCPKPEVRSSSAASWTNAAVQLRLAADGVRSTTAALAVTTLPYTWALDAIAAYRII